jgi:hypothetical protein
MGLASAAGSGDWFGYPQYPGARALCEQRVYGTSEGQGIEIHASYFVTIDGPEKVKDFYSKTSFRIERKDSSFTVHRNSHSTLSVHRAATMPFPGCESRLAADEKTVIEVSELLRSGRKP